MLRQAKGGHNGLLPCKAVCPHPGGSGEESYSIDSRVGLLTRTGCVQGLLSRVIFLMSFSDFSPLDSGDSLAVPPLISNCLNLPFGTQGRSWRLESAPYKQGAGNRGEPRSPRVLLSLKRRHSRKISGPLECTHPMCAAERAGWVSPG